MLPVLEAVPNFSEGRDPGFLDEVARVAARCGVEVLDRSMDPDHHRAVVTFIGDPASVESAAVAVAEVALARIDLRDHRGAHPRIGALDVLPFVPLLGCTMEDAVRSARRVGARLADLGLPVYFYQQASSPPGRTLAELRRGGFEALGPVFPSGRQPDLTAGRTGPHPTAGATCVGARALLLAWNVWVEGVSPDTLRALAREVRERDGGFRGLRALALELPRQGGLQLSMNLENVDRGHPMEVFLAVESRLGKLGGRVLRTEVIGMVPDTLVLQAAGHRLRLSDASPERLLPVRVAEHLSRFAGADLETLLSWVENQAGEIPHDIQLAARRLTGRLAQRPSPGDPG